MWTIHWYGMMGQALGLWDLIRVCNDQSHHHGPCAVQGTYLTCGEFRFKIPFKDKQDADSLCAYLRVMCASEIEETDGRTRLEVVFEGTGRECPTAVGYPGEPGVVGPVWTSQYRSTKERCPTCGGWMIDIGGNDILCLNCCKGIKCGTCGKPVFHCGCDCGIRGLLGTGPCPAGVPSEPAGNLGSQGPAACSAGPCNPVCRGNQGHQAPAEPA
jgi:hypothetical protein